MDKGNGSPKLNVRIFKSKWFVRFARQNHITNKDLCDAVERAENGLVDADLGGNVIKQRIARSNEGRSGGFRSIILFRVEEKAFFVFGFVKSDQDNISAADLKDFKDAATLVFKYSEEELELAMEDKKFAEVDCDEQN